MAVSQSKLERIFEKNPTSVVFARLADTLLQEGNAKRAIEVCRKGLKYRPSYATGHLVLGKCYLALERVEEARQEFHKVLRLDASYLSALWHLGGIEGEMGWDDASIAHYKQALALDLFNTELETLVLRKQPESSVPQETEPSDILDELESPTHSSSPFDAEPDPEAPLGNLVQEIARIEARANSSNGIEVEPIITPTLAEIYANQGLMDQAVEILEQLCRRDPGNTVAKARLEAYRTSSGV